MPTNTSPTPASRPINLDLKVRSPQENRRFPTQANFRLIDLNSVRAIVRLTALVHQAGQHPRDRQMALLDGVRRLFGASHGQCTLAQLHHRTGEQVIRSRVEIPPARPTSASLEADIVGPSPCIETFLSLHGMQLVARIELYRPADGARFTPAERAAADLLHAEFAWVYGVGDPCQRSS